MGYKVLADLVVLVHFLWILFLFLGALLSGKSKALRIFHLSGLLFAVIIQISGWYCPLTDLEVWLRSRQNPDLIYTGSFIIHYLERLIYVELSRLLLFGFTLLLIGFNTWIYVRKPDRSDLQDQLCKK